MENVLAVYHRPLDPARPVVCLDEQPVQLVGEVASPLPQRPGDVRKSDYEYVRNGTANLFMMTEPLAGWREVVVTERRTRLDFAEQVRHLAEDVYPAAAEITLVLDNLSTHKPAALYEAFEPQRARAILERVTFVHTPKHGSWLNIAECELSVMTRQSLSDRIPDTATLRAQTQAWSQHRNRAQRGVDWHFTTDQARIKLKRLYPKTQV